MLSISYTQAIYQQSIWSVYWDSLNKVVMSKTEHLFNVFAFYDITSKY